jgi:hypothetical protein
MNSFAYFPPRTPQILALINVFTLLFVILTPHIRKSVKPICLCTKFKYSRNHTSSEY